VELAISNEVFALLKQSNVGRFALLSELLSRLGLNCDKPAAPALTPVCLLATSQVTGRRYYYFLSPPAQTCRQEN